MRVHSSDPGTREGFLARVADAADVEPAEVRPEARLLEDLDLDSIALLELIASLVGSREENGSLFDELAGREWSGTTVDELWRRFDAAELK